MSDTVKNAQKRLEKSAKETETERKWSITLASATIREQEALKPRKGVADCRGKVREGKRADGDTRMGRFMLALRRMDVQEVPLRLTCTFSPDRI